MNNNNNKDIPLCVDLDGTLIYSDTLAELFLRLLARKPYMIFILPFWLLKGIPFFKKKLSENFSKYITQVPINSSLLKFLCAQKELGRKIYLVTACEEKLAKSIANELHVFDEVFGTKNGINLKSKNKAQFLIDKFGDNNFAYAGNDTPDLKVWKHSKEMIFVNASSSLKKKAIAQNPTKPYLNFPKSQNRIVSFLKLMRIHQWVKNGLVFIPLILSHQYFNHEKIVESIIAFLSLGLCASATYIFNDCIDIENDRHHARKKHRPLADGQVPILQALSMIIIFAMASVYLSLLIGINMLILLCVYVVITITYSLILKKLSIIDIITLSILYIYRIYFGALATQVDVSFWLISFSIFMFFSLGSMKRYIELMNIKDTNLESIKGRNYLKSDINVIAISGVSSGIMSVLLYIIYIDNAATGLYLCPEYLMFGSILFLYFIVKMWLMASRGLVHDDPIVYAIKNKENYVIMALFAVIFVMASPISK